MITLSYSKIFYFVMKYVDKNLQIIEIILSDDLMILINYYS